MSIPQPVEQFTGLRAVPGLTVIRRADANETAVVWRVALEAADCPVALVLTRQNVPTLDRNQCAAAEGLRQGAYVLAAAPNGRPGVIPIATGSEVALIVAARHSLQVRNAMACAISMPNWELFNGHPEQGEKLAANGYVARAVDLYEGKVATDPPEAPKLKRGLRQDRAIGDLKAAFDYLSGRTNVDSRYIGSLG